MRLGQQHRLQLLRLDGGNDAIENIAVVEAHNEQEENAAPAHYVIKWNPRKESPEQWLAYAEEHGYWSEPRPGKRVALFEVRETRTHDGNDYSLRRVMRVIKRTIDKHGQQLLVPEIEIEGWWTSLEFDEEMIIALYADHGTSEQFHSELKTDLDIEGKDKDRRSNRLRQDIRDIRHAWSLGQGGSEYAS